VNTVQILRKYSRPLSHPSSRKFNLEYSRNNKSNRVFTSANSVTCLTN